MGQPAFDDGDGADDPTPDEAAPNTAEATDAGPGGAGWADGSLADLTGRQCVERLRAAHQGLLEAEIAELRLIAQLADIHGYTPDTDPDSSQGWDPAGAARRGRERALQVADGTPPVGEFLAIEIGAALQVPAGTARARLRETLELRHRHPHLWAAVLAGRLRLWVAGKIVRATRTAELTAHQAGWVDTHTVQHLDLPVGRLLGRVDGLIVAADPAGHDLRRLARLAQRFARVGKTNHYGVRSFYAQADAADIAFVDAMIARVADILADQPAHAGQSVDVRRAAAFGLLARPAELAHLLTTHTTTSDATGRERQDAGPSGETGEGATAEGAAEQGTAADANPDRDGQDCDGQDRDGQDPDSQEGPEFTLIGDTTDTTATAEGWVPDRDRVPGEPPTDTDCDAECVPPDPADHPDNDGAPGSRTMAGVPVVLDPADCAPKAVLYIHLAEDTLAGNGPGNRQIARIEHLGPATLNQLRQHLDGCRVTITPVINIGATDYAVDSYEIPQRMRTIVRLRDPYETAPYGTRPSRSPLVDLDHTDPYRWNPDGTPAVPGQTRPDNLAPLGRYTHRARTHTGLQVRRLAPGVHLWVTEYGQVVLTDHTGSHDLGLTLQQPDQHTRTSTTSPPGTGPPGPFPAGYLDNDGYYHDADGNCGGPEPVLPDDPDPDPDDWPWADAPAPDWLDAYPDDYQPPLPDDPDPDAAAWLVA